jgi:hypothetical protein
LPLGLASTEGLGVAGREGEEGEFSPFHGRDRPPEGKPFLVGAKDQQMGFVDSFCSERRKSARQQRTCDTAATMALSGNQVVNKSSPPILTESHRVSRRPVGLSQTDMV